MSVRVSLEALSRPLAGAASPIAELFIERGSPGHIRSDNGSEFIATTVQAWLGQGGVKTVYVTPGSPWRTVAARASTARFATCC